MWEPEVIGPRRCPFGFDPSGMKYTVLTIKAQPRTNPRLGDWWRIAGRGGGSKWGVKIKSIGAK